MDLSRRATDDLTGCEMIAGTGHYSGPEPQPLPLPPELFVRALSFLEKIHDKQNARLACKGFAACGLPSLTSTVYFSTSLMNKCCAPKGILFSCPAQEIALHPVVSKYITCIVCDGTLLPDLCRSLGGFQTWWEGLGKQPSAWPVERIHSLYALKNNQDELIISKGEDRRIFLTALECFVNLKRVEFTDVAADEHNRTLPRPTWPSTIPSGDLWAPTSPYHTFVMCIRSLSEMAIKLCELSIKGQATAMSHSIFSSASPEDFNHLTNVFASLRKTSLHIMCQKQEPLSFAGIGRLLTSSTFLQSLDLKCTDAHRQPRLILSRVFQNFTWPHLKHLGLDGFTMHSDVELIYFFVRHRKTLNSVGLRDMFLHHRDPSLADKFPCEAWKELFRKLRERTILFQALDLFQIHDCANWRGHYPDLALRAHSGAIVVRYLRDGGKNPLELERFRDEAGV